MVPIDRDEVARLMARMAAGDAAAVFAVVDAFGARLAGVVRRHLFAVGRRDVASCRDDVDYLVQSAALVLLDRAGGWSPDGALPWVWADRAIRAEVVAYLGHPTAELDVDRLDAAAPGDGGSGGVTGPAGGSAGGPPVGAGAGGAGGAGGPSDLTRLAERHPVVALLDRAIAEVASERDRRVHVEYGIQKRSGDASPAHTVAAELGLTPENVRQIDLRVRRRLRALIERDPRFAALRDLGWLAA